LGARQKKKKDAHSPPTGQGKYLPEKRKGTPITSKNEKKKKNEKKGRTHGLDRSEAHKGKKVLMTHCPTRGKRSQGFKMREKKKKQQNLQSQKRAHERTLMAEQGARQGRGVHKGSHQENRPGVIRNKRRRTNQVNDVKGKNVSDPTEKKKGEISRGGMKNEWKHQWKANRERHKKGKKKGFLKRKRLNVGKSKKGGERKATTIEEEAELGKKRKRRKEIKGEHGLTKRTVKKKFDRKKNRKRNQKKE